MSNAIIYYDKFKVVLVKALLHHHDNMDFPEHFIFAADDEQIKPFLAYVYDRTREYHQRYVTVFVDNEENETERKKEWMTHMVSREDVIRTKK